MRIHPGGTDRKAGILSNRWRPHIARAVAAAALLLAAVLLLYMPQIARADGPNDWPMPGHDPAQTGLNPSEAVLTPPLRLKWTYSANDTFGNSAVSGGILYVGSYDGQVYALEGLAGTTRWSYRTNGRVFGPAVASGVVYVGTWTLAGKVYALDATTGALKWSYQTNGAVRDPLVAGGRVYVRSLGGPSQQENWVYALEAASGALQWAWQLPSSGGTNQPSSLTVMGDTVYVGSSEGTLFALNAATGSQRWSYYVGGTINGVTALGDMLYVSPGQHKLLALDSDTRFVRWSYELSNDPSRVAVAEGTVYVGSMAGGVYAVDASTGTLKWSFQQTVSGVTDQPVVANGVVYASSGGRLYALSSATGSLVWSYIGERPAVAGGLVYIAAPNNNLHALETAPPTSLVTSLPYAAAASFPLSWTVPITWTGTNAASYDVQYRDGASGLWTDLLSSTPITSSTFSGQDGHSYYFRARSRTATGALGDWSEAVSTMVDLSPPTGSVSINGGALYATTVTVTLNLSATDAASGPGQMAFSNDGATWSDWGGYSASKTWVLTAGDGLKTVYGRFRDNAGNASAAYSDTITLLSAPTSGPILINGGALYTRLPTATLTLSPPDLPNTSQMRFSDDGLSYSSFEPFTTTRPYTMTVGDGLKTVWAQYTVTETVTGPYSDTIILDTAPPTATVGSLAAYQTSASFPVSWSATDATSGPAAYDLQYRDGTTGSWTGWITATTALSSTFTGQDGRTYYFRARAADNAGNQGDHPAEAQAQTTVDTTPPIGSLSAPAYASSAAITLTLAATDSFGVAGMAFSSDGASWGSWETYTTTRPYTLASGDGQKTVYGKFRDNAGNYSSPYSATVVLDTAPPGQAFPDDGVSGTSRNPTPTFSWAPVTDNLSGVAGYSWRVDSGTETYTTTSTVLLPSQADGEHTFYVRALDRAGNYGSYGSHLFTINTAAPAPPDILQPQSPTAADKIIVSGAAPPNSTVKLYANGVYFAQATAGAYGIWNLVNVPIIMGENVLKATATDAFALTSALSSPMVVMRVPVYYAPPADMASGVVAPSAGGTVTTTNNYMVIVPQGAITQSVKVVLTPLAPQSAPTVFGIAGTESYVALSAVTSDTGEKVVSFQEPVTVTLSYDPAKLTAPESSLAIHYYDEALGRWVALPSLVDTVNHTVSAQTTHFTVFGVLASLPWRGYLPLVTRGYASGW